MNGRAGPVPAGGLSVAWEIGVWPEARQMAFRTQLPHSNPGPQVQPLTR